MKNESIKEKRKKSSNQKNTISKTAYKKIVIARVEKTAINKDVEAAKLYFLENFICFNTFLRSDGTSYLYL
jgi:hypothetical protein